jgi:hypothetical protein
MNEAIRYDANAVEYTSGPSSTPQTIMQAMAQVVGQLQRNADLNTYDDVLFDSSAIEAVP